MKEKKGIVNLIPYLAQIKAVQLSIPRTGNVNLLKNLKLQITNLNCGTRFGGGRSLYESSEKSFGKRRYFAVFLQTKSGRGKKKDQEGEHMAFL